MKIAIVTGASSGLGKEFAIAIAKRFRKVEEIWLVARRLDRLEQTKEAVEENGKKCRIFAADVTKKTDLNKIENAIKKEGHEIRVLVNAAGYGMIGSVSELSYQDNIGMIKTNCEGLTAYTYEFLPYLTKNANIINIASSAAFLPQPKFAVYAASKSYVLSFSKALNQELKATGTTVTAVCPGPVKTEFFDIAETYHEVALYKKLVMADAKKVVNKALNDAYLGKTMSVYGFAMKAFRVLSKVLPDEWLLLFIR